MPNPGTGLGGQGTAVRSVTQPSYLSALPDVIYPDGSEVYIVANSQGNPNSSNLPSSGGVYWYLNKRSTSAPDGCSVIATKSGLGRWLLGVGLPYYVTSPRLMFMGDSNTSGGSYAGTQGSWAQVCIQYLRTLRSDFDVVASQIVTSELSAGSSLPFNEGHSGYTQAQLAAGYPGYCTAAGGPPDILVGDMAGTNDIATGRTLAQMQVDAITLYNTVIAQNPNTIILLMAPPPFVAGTTVSTNLAAWNATQQAFTTWIQNTLVPSRPNIVYCPASQITGNGEIGLDGVHYTQAGCATVGVAAAKQLNLIMGPPRNDVLPKVFRSRQAWQSAQCLVSANDGANIASHPGFNPGSGSFTVAVDFYPTATMASESAIISYGAQGTNNFYGVTVGPSNLKAYWMSGTALTGTQFSGSPGLNLNQWNRIVLMADSSSGWVALYVNGQLACISTATVPAWTSTQQVFTVAGQGSTWNGALGLYGRVHAYGGVPGRPGGMAALLAVENDYYYGASIVPGKLQASYSLNGVKTDDCYAPGQPNNNAVFQGTFGFVAAYSGTPATLTGTVSVANNSTAITFSGNQTLSVGQGLQFSSQPGVTYYLASNMSTTTAGTLITAYNGANAGAAATSTISSPPRPWEQKNLGPSVG